jgi:formylglycine-generating enzyme required for sulfatase activity
MLGNVWEWVADVYHKDYQASLMIDPKGPPSGNYRVWRGGSWFVDARHLRASFRGRGGPDSRLHELGFRCALDAIP